MSTVTLSAQVRARTREQNLYRHINKILLRQDISLDFENMMIVYYYIDTI